MTRLQSILIVFFAAQTLLFTLCANAQTQTPTAIEDRWKVRGWAPSMAGDPQASVPNSGLKKSTDASMEADSGVPLNRADTIGSSYRATFATAKGVFDTLKSCDRVSDVDGSHSKEERAVCAGAFLTGRDLKVMDTAHSEIFVKADVITNSPAIRVGWRLRGGLGSFGGVN